MCVSLTQLAQKCCGIESAVTVNLCVVHMGSLVHKLLVGPIAVLTSRFHQMQTLIIFSGSDKFNKQISFCVVHTTTCNFCQLLWICAWYTCTHVGW